MNISYLRDRTIIYNGGILCKKKTIINYVNEIVEYRELSKRTVKRTNNSYVREWLGKIRLHQKDIVLKEKNNILEEILWLIIGR